jgi:deoxyribodipyrimidine photolyase-related protein
MTRVYFSSSNYILKMSDIMKGPWCQVWDAVYYSFIAKHYNLLKSNYATSRQTVHWKNKSPKEKAELLQLAKKYNI